MADDSWAPPGAASALVAYCALLLGFFAIGIVTQQRDVIAGLWVTEALAIALPALARSWGPAVAVLLTGAMFSVLHLNKVGFVGLWEIGILLALLRLWSGSLWPSMLCHAANNALAGAAFLLGWEDPAVPPPPLLLAAGAVLLVAGLFVAVRVIRGLP